MTKMKSKKMAKSTFAIIIMGIVMVAMLAFGGTFAYFTATSTTKTSDAITTAKVVLGADTTATLSITETRNLLPKDEVTLSATVSNTSDVDTWVFVQIKLDTSAITAESASLNFSDSLKGTDGTTWTPITKDGYSGLYYMTVTATTDVELEATGTFECDAMSKDGVQDTTAMAKDLTVTVKFASAQKDHLTTASLALDEVVDQFTAD